MGRGVVSSVVVVMVVVVGVGVVVITMVVVVSVVVAVVVGVVVVGGVSALTILRDTRDDDDTRLVHDVLYSLHSMVIWE